MFLLFSVGPANSQDIFSPSRHDPIPAELEAMYLKGLKYLTTTQSRDGSWTDNQGSQPGVVGLAVMAMMAHGEDPNLGPYADHIKRGLDFILRNSNRDNGYIGSSMYNHGFAALALAEAYGSVDDPRLGPALQKAIDLILNSQRRNPNNAWRYSPESQDADTTVSGAQVVALFAARNAGLAVPDEAVVKALRFFQRCQSADGGIGYMGPDGPNSTRTAIGALSWALAKQKDTQQFKNASAYLAGAGFATGHYPFYHEYYAAQAFFHMSEEAWNEWNARNMKYLATSQRPDGSWEGQHGSTFSTAGALLSLALNYRFLPIYER